MTALLTSLLFAAGAAAWVYTKLGRRTGAGNQRSAFIGAAVSGVIAFLFFFTLLKFVFRIN